MISVDENQIRDDTYLSCDFHELLACLNQGWINNKSSIGLFYT